jgi:hypothetical protein
VWARCTSHLAVNDLLGQVKLLDHAQRDGTTAGLQQQRNGDAGVQQQQGSSTRAEGSAILLGQGQHLHGGELVLKCAAKLVEGLMGCNNTAVPLLEVVMTGAGSWVVLGSCVMQLLQHMVSLPHTSWPMERALALMGVAAVVFMTSKLC